MFKMSRSPDIEKMIGRMLIFSKVYRNSPPSCHSKPVLLFPMELMEKEMLLRLCWLPLFYAVKMGGLKKDKKINIKRSI